MKSRKQVFLHLLMFSWCLMEFTAYLLVYLDAKCQLPQSSPPTLTWCPHTQGNHQTGIAFCLSSYRACTQKGSLTYGSQSPSEPCTKISTVLCGSGKVQTILSLLCVSGQVNCRLPWWPEHKELNIHGEIGAWSPMCIGEEKGYLPQHSCLVIPWTEEPSGCLSSPWDGSQNDWATGHFHYPRRIKWVKKIIKPNFPSINTCTPQLRAELNLNQREIF